MKIHVATSQFPTDADIRSNLRYVLDQMRSAKEQEAHVVHFPEAALSGYAGADFPSYEGFDWDMLTESTEKILEYAEELGLWVILGSTHRLSAGNKPHNSLYIINDQGRIVDRYDKRFCSGDESAQSGDLAHYSPGNHFCVFEIDGVRCGTLICYDNRYPELYREYKRSGVQLIFHSYHAGHIDAERFRSMQAAVGSENWAFNSGSTIPEIIQPATMHAAAASNYVWISCPNSCARESCWPSFFVRPDGIITGRLQPHTAGILVSSVDTEAEFYDSTVAWRGRAMDRVLHSGELVDDPRSAERTSL
jgi:predicted amidohydrolase